jgi:hypothetical protein
VVQGIAVTLVGKQSTTSNLTVKIVPTNGGSGATSHTVTFNASNTTFTLGGPTDLWGIPTWSLPYVLNSGGLSFDITATWAGAGSAEAEVTQVIVTVTYQNPGNYLYARDLTTWADCGLYGAASGTPYAEANVVFGNITLSEPGAQLFPLQHVVGYFDAVGTLGDGGTASQPDLWILPNEIAPTFLPFIYLPEIVQEPPIGQTNPSRSLQQLRWPVNMQNSQLASQFMHHLQVKIQFEPENAPNTIKALAFKENQE